MSDIEVSNSWQWIKSNRPLTYTNWHSDQPTNRPGEDCGVLWTAHSFEWGDHFCKDNTEMFICETE